MPGTRKRNSIAQRIENLKRQLAGAERSYTRSGIKIDRISAQIKYLTAQAKEVVEKAN